jgi:hypothetical protein
MAESGMLLPIVLAIGMTLYASNSFSFYIVYVQFGQLAVRLALQSPVIRNFSLYNNPFLQSILSTIVFLLIGLDRASGDARWETSTTKRSLPKNANYGRMTAATTTAASNRVQPLAVDITAETGNGNNCYDLKALSTRGDDGSSEI